MDSFVTQTEVKPAASELPPWPTFRRPALSPVSASTSAIAPSLKLIAQTLPAAIVSELGRVRMPGLAASTIDGFSARGSPPLLGRVAACRRRR